MKPEIETALKQIESRVNAGDPVACAVDTVARVLCAVIADLGDPATQKTQAEKDDDKSDGNETGDDAAG